MLCEKYDKINRGLLRSTVILILTIKDATIIYYRQIMKVVNRSYMATEINTNKFVWETVCLCINKLPNSLQSYL